MTLGKLAALYLGTAAIFFALDLAWLTVATPRLYRPLLGELLLEKPSLGVAGAFYLAFVVGVLALAVIPGLAKASLAGAIWRGALLGLLAYATYDLTNLATLKGWAWQVSLADMAWGMALNAVVAAGGYGIGSLLGLVGRG